MNIINKTKYLSKRCGCIVLKYKYMDMVEK